MKFLILSPYALIHTWRLQEMLLANSLLKSGFEVEIAGCSGTLNHCVVKHAKKVSWKDELSKMNKVCDECKRFDKSFGQIKNFSFTKLDDLINAKDYKIINKYIENNNIYDENLSFHDINVNKLSCYNILINFQISEVNGSSSTEIKHAYLQELKNVLIGILIAERKIEIYKPNIVIYCNGFYPLEKSFYEVSKKNDVTCYYYCASNNHQRMLSRFQIGKTNSRNFVDHLLNEWSYYKHIPLFEEELKDSYEHLFKYIFDSFYACYSEKIGNGNCDVILKNSLNRKIVILSMSSEDELVSAQKIGYKIDSCKQNSFSNQIEWISETIKWAKTKEDVFLVIRPHPREFANKRNNYKSDSQRGKELRNIFENYEAENIFFCWPEYKISIYELFEHCKMLINGWSSVGVEAGMLGIPVLNSFPSYMNEPFDLDHYTNKDKSYSAELCKMLNEKWSHRRMIKFARWRHLYSNRAEIKFLDYPIKNTSPPTNFETQSMEFINWRDRISKIINESSMDEKFLEMFRSGSDSVLEIEKSSHKNLNSLTEVHGEVKALKNICSKYISLRSKSDSVLTKSMNRFIKFG